MNLCSCDLHAKSVRSRHQIFFSLLLFLFANIDGLTPRWWQIEAVWMKMMRWFESRASVPISDTTSKLCQRCAFHGFCCCYCLSSMKLWTVTRRCSELPPPSCVPPPPLPPRHPLTAYSAYAMDFRFASIFTISSTEISFESLCFGFVSSFNLKTCPAQFPAIQFRVIFGFIIQHQHCERASA